MSGRSCECWDYTYKPIFSRPYSSTTLAARTPQAARGLRLAEDEVS
jgi:hypothetical protein